MLSMTALVPVKTKVGTPQRLRWDAAARAPRDSGALSRPLTPRPTVIMVRGTKRSFVLGRSLCFSFAAAVTKARYPIGRGWLAPPTIYPVRKCDHDCFCELPTR